jgi:tetratricopeptide (TPR) repeat protein
MTERPAAPLTASHQQWLEQIDSALRGQGLEAAARLSLQALAEGVEHPSVLNLAATARYGEGRFEDAAELLNRAQALAPRDPHVLNSLGVCLQALGRTDPAMKAYDEALKVDPRMAPAHFNRGSLLQDLNDIKSARAAYQQAAALDPNYVEALAGLAWLDAQAGDADSARLNGERGLKLAPANLLARMALASADLQRGDLPAAGTRLAALIQEPGLTPVNRSIVFGLAGDVLDAEDRPAEAFAAYAAANAGLKALNAARFEAPGMESALDQVRRLTSWFEAADPEPWRQAPPVRPRSEEPAAHVFLVGFPRSGTTLLENILAAHPQVVSLEEKDCLEIVSAHYLASGDGLDRLASMDSSEAARQRETYWALVGKYGVEPRGRVFIDKMPLASVQLPVIAKLFPDARILFARRDPRDVVLSCFRRRFGMNPSMYQLLTLDGAAAYYDAVMRLSEQYRNLLPLPQHVVRYESLVEDFEGTARAACGFLGIEWNPGLVDFAARARARGISTPSAAQVARGLNREGQGAWRRYAKQLAPVLPLLEPWVRQFGYEPGGS